MKTVKIIPIFKSGDSYSTVNYRPISMLPFLSKIFEKLMCAFWQDRHHGNRSIIHSRIWVNKFKNWNNFSCFNFYSIQEKYLLTMSYSIIKSYMEGNKCGNVLWYSYWRTQPHADPYIEKSIYIILVILIVVIIIRISDFTIINNIHITPIGISINLL